LSPGSNSFGGAVSFLPDLSPEKVQALIDTNYIEKSGGGGWLGGPRTPVNSSHTVWIAGGVIALLIVAIVIGIVSTRKKKKQGRRR